MIMGPKGWDGNYGKWPNYIVWLIEIINCEKWGNEMELLRLEMYGKKGVVELFFTHRIEMLIEYPFVHLFSV